jgi:DNA-directed RNA polymerase subunit M/transcription elongation factor TFIIS
MLLSRSTSQQNWPSIIFTTLQKFMPCGTQTRNKNESYDGNDCTARASEAEMRQTIQALAGKATGKQRIVVVADEAHRSHGARQSMALHRALADTMETSSGDVDITSIEGRSSVDAKAVQGAHICYIAFTATPSDMALKLFGTARVDKGLDTESNPKQVVLAPYLSYPLSAAVQNGCIHNCLAHYSTVSPTIKLLNEGTLGERDEHTRQLAELAGLSPMVIRKKIKYIGTHYLKYRVRSEVRSSDAFMPKAMVVVRSREHVILYTRCIRAHVKNTEERPVIYGAFSGEVTSKITPTSDLRTYTESSLNESISLRSAHILVVCQKLETGYDDPDLCLMYIDKPISGSHAVQVLSRLNRTRSHKTGTVVVDFVNSAHSIRESFERFWGLCTLSASVSSSRVQLMSDLDRVTARLASFLIEGRLLNTSISCLCEASHTSCSTAFGGISSVHTFESDLDAYISLCHKLGRQRLELPLSTACVLKTIFQRKWKGPIDALVDMKQRQRALIHKHESKKHDSNLMAHTDSADSLVSQLQDAVICTDLKETHVGEIRVHAFGGSSTEIDNTIPLDTKSRRYVANVAAALDDLIAAKLKQNSDLILSDLIREQSPDLSAQAVQAVVSELKKELITHVGLAESSETASRTGCELNVCCRSPDESILIWLLHRLDTLGDVTVDLLRETKIGFVLNKMKKLFSKQEQYERVYDATSKLLLRYKGIYDRELSLPNTLSVSSVRQCKRLCCELAGKRLEGAIQLTKVIAARVEATGLSKDGQQVDAQHLAEIGQQIEARAHEKFGDSIQKKRKLHSIAANLTTTKDEHDLWRRVWSGELMPANLVDLPVEKLNHRVSSELQKKEEERRKIASFYLEEQERVLQSGGVYQCPTCQSNNVSIKSLAAKGDWVSSNGADNVYHCLKCGYRWEE